MWTSAISKPFMSTILRCTFRKRRQHLQTLLYFSPCSATNNLSGNQDMHCQLPLKPHLVQILLNLPQCLQVCTFNKSMCCNRKTNVCAVKAHSISVRVSKDHFETVLPYAQQQSHTSAQARESSTFPLGLVAVHQRCRTAALVDRESETLLARSRSGPPTTQHILLLLL